MSARDASARISPQRGFTLLEIMVVVLLIGLMFSAATANLGRFLPASRSEKTVRTLISQMEIARTSAIAFGRPYHFEMDMDKEQYRIVTPFDEDGKFALTAEERTDLGWTSVDAGMNLETIIDATGWKTDEGVFVLDYDSSGAARDFTLFLVNEFAPGFDLTLRMSGLTGSAVVFKGRVPMPQVDEDDL